ncbi:MAG: dynamin family protein [Pseudomonadota bacterium]
MNMQPNRRQEEFNAATRRSLLSTGERAFADFGLTRDAIAQAMSVLRDMADATAARRLDKLMRQLEAFEPSVTMIGQIKSGKTTLVNAMVGEPDLLPADVNPWTSVVTSLHLHPETPGFENSASFRFFDESEWDRLVSGGGRIGELASRAGADDELAKIKRQVEEMREKSRQRLGRKFELLLGQQRDYGYFDKALIERFVCLGDAFDDEEDISDDQGQFADITKSADLSMQRLGLPIRLCIRDTPGVNDTFMMREQITIRAIRESRMCVVVLSAHQALSSTDLALIRMVSQVKSRDVVIFVNRIDELSNPADQVPEIAHSIRDTLKRHNGPSDADVIFGSALWATHALEGGGGRLPPGSAKSLENWAQSRNETYPIPTEPASRCWKLSGLADLQAALAREITRGIGAGYLQRLAVSAVNLGHGITAGAHLKAVNAAAQSSPTLDIDTAKARANDLVASEMSAFEAEFDTIHAEFSDRLDRVQASFLERATHSLIEHLERSGEEEPWTYDPAGLRVLLNSSHKVLARKSQSAFGKAAARSAEAFSGLYRDALCLTEDQMQISLPRAPVVPPPVSLGQTIALDLQGRWWNRWWKARRGYKAYADAYHDLIKSETNPVIEDLRDDLAKAVRESAVNAFRSFLLEQQEVFGSLVGLSETDGAVDAFIARSGGGDRRQQLNEAMALLSEAADS